MNDLDHFLDDDNSDLIGRLIEFAGDTGIPPCEDAPELRFNPENQEKRQIDVERIFGGSGDPCDFDATREDLDDIERAFEEGEPTRNDPEATEGLWPLKWETCAWYQPIHFYRLNWGIYIKEDCVLNAAKRFARFVPKHEQGLFTPTQWLNRLSVAALLAYYYHEHYHHRVESMGFRFHVILGRPCYVPYKTGVYHVLKANLSRYPAGPYIHGWAPDEQLEEALANANSFRNMNLRGRVRAKVSEPVFRTARRALRWQFRYDPPGYRKAPDYLRPHEFRAGENILKERILSATLAPGPVPKWDFTPELSKGFFGRRTQFWGVVDHGGRRYFPVI